MRTAFRPEQLADPHLKEAEHALRTCVHCGFCTATCPTYLVLGDERDSPRGRIMLIQNMLESDRRPTRETVRHLDRCLSCLGCRTTCPSGVDYSALIDTARLHIAKNYRRGPFQILFRSAVLYLLMRPRLFAFASVLARIFAPVLPGKLGAMAKKAKRRKRRKTKMRFVLRTSPEAPKVLLLEGCAQRALAPEIDEAAARVLARRDVKTETAPLCCGALAYHMGNVGIAKRCAKRVIEAFEDAKADALTMTASGCVAFLKDYGSVFAGEPKWVERAQAMAARVEDFSELADAPKTPIADEAARALTIAYHPPCSLQHGQRIHGRGEQLLKEAGFNLVPIPDAHLCCGSAGSYSLLQPKIAEQLRARKLDAIRSTGATIIASGNIGCLTQLSGELPTAHIAELLDWAAGGPKPI